MSQFITVTPYNPAWPDIFKKESKSISAALKSNLIEIHHIGSTAVPGMPSKPKVDILAVVKNPLSAIEQLEKISFEYKGEYNIPFHYGFSKQGYNPVNLHVYEKDHPEIELNLTFRDYSRQNNYVRNDYALLKKELLKDEAALLKNNSPFTNYTLRKGDFIRSILKRTGFSRLRVLRVNDETEIMAARYLRQEYFSRTNSVNAPYLWTFNHPEHAHLVLYEGAEIIGYIHIQLWPGNRAALRTMVIDEEKRNKSAGSEFLALCERWLKTIGIKSLHAESRQSALRFYKRNGYTEIPFNDPEEHKSDPNDVAVGKIL